MIILKFIKNTTLILLIILIIFIPASIYLVKFKNSSFLGEQLKSSVLKIPKLVELFNLNAPGDARYFYVRSENKNLSVEVVLVNSKSSNGRVDKWLQEIISETVNKYATVTNTLDIQYPKKELLTDEDLNKIRADTISKGKSDVYLIYVSSYSDKESSVGVVVHRDTIFIFKDAIDRLSERGYVKDIVEKTTIMHEWGHLLATEHIEDENCIMNEFVEILDSSPTGRNLPTKYCWKELREFTKLDQE